MEALLPPEVFAWFVPALALLLALLCAGFALRFVLPALRLGWELRGAIRALKGLATEVPADPGKIAREAMNTRHLAHLWREFAQTLHSEQATAASGKPQRWRATALAETFFTEHALVDTPLKTEFYKHLPGILTGIGILGTFAGLIGGLSQFAVTADANAVRSSLGALIHSVGHAFRISAAAIGLAMLFTWIEKSLVAARCRQVAELVQLIDSLFEAGAGEEYLARLVRASETSAAQSGNLREAVLGALREALLESAAQQRASSQQEQQQLAATIARAIGEGVSEPMGRLAGAIERNASNQSQQLGSQLGETLSRALAQFSARMDERYGKEMSALQAAQQQAQSESAALLRDAASHIRALAQEMQRMGAATQNSVAQIADSGRGTAHTFENSAQTLNSASSDLAAASHGIASTAQLLTRTGSEITLAANGLGTASALTRETLAAQSEAQQGFAALLLDLRQTIEQARREASLTNDLVSRLEAGASKLGQAERQAESYLQGVNAVLGEAHAAFARNVEKTLREGNSQFQRELGEAVEHLRTGIDDLGDLLDVARARR
ncbi:MAG: hypothetical protein WAZ34_02945 [Rhodocyclaceae bacterium]